MAEQPATKPVTLRCGASHKDRPHQHCGQEIGSVPSWLAARMTYTGTVKRSDPADDGAIYKSCPCGATNRWWIGDAPCVRTPPEQGYTSPEPERRTA